MKYKFSAQGHKNIQGTHKTTFEITTDKELSLKGDCIIGINSNFDPNELKKLLKFPKLKMTLKVSDVKEEIFFEPNPSFFDSKELVIRLNAFISDRVLGINATKSSLFMNRRIFELMKNPEQVMEITLESVK